MEYLTNLNFATNLLIQDSGGSAETDDYVISQMKTRPGNKHLSSEIFYLIDPRTLWNKAAKTIYRILEF